MPLPYSPDDEPRPAAPPRLLPLPPTMSITQMMNVASSGSNTNGSTYRKPCAYSAPPMPITASAEYERLQLEAEDILACRRGRFFVLPDGAQDTTPTGSLSHAGPRSRARRRTPQLPLMK